MAPKANLLTTDEVAGVMKTAMEKPSGRPVVEPKWWTRLMAVVDDVSKRNDELRAELKAAQAAAAAASTSAAAAATGAGDAASRLEKENAELKKKLEAMNASQPAASDNAKAPDNATNAKAPPPALDIHKGDDVDKNKRVHG